jgi:hypothetical protein
MKLQDVLILSSAGIVPELEPQEARVIERRPIANLHGLRKIGRVYSRFVRS